MAVNDLTDAATLAHLLEVRLDPRALPGHASRPAGEDALEIDGSEMKVLAERDPAALPWGELGVDVVIESTGLLHRPRERRQAPRGRARRR